MGDAPRPEAGASTPPSERAQRWTPLWPYTLAYALYVPLAVLYPPLMFSSAEGITFLVAVAWGLPALLRSAGNARKRRAARAGGR